MRICRSVYSKERYDYNTKNNYNFMMSVLSNIVVTNHFRSDITSKHPRSSKQQYQPRGQNTS